MGNSGRRVGSCSLFWGGRGRDNVVSELLVAALGLDGTERKVVTVLGLNGSSWIVTELLVNSSNVLLAT